ncbi:putative GST-like protein YibF [Thalassocella blandensis]|nr:putative GST-like protein YibF [Thalassocella blandensis]
MQLFYSLTSPYARKCHIVLHLHQLLDQTELVLTDQFSQEFRKLNPLGKIPTLRDNDITLMDSPLICEYLDNKAIQQGRPSLFARENLDYFHIQLQHALSNGILDAAVASVYEKRRETQPSEYWLSRWQESLQSTITQISTKYLSTCTQPNIASVATVTALAYLDFRLAELSWRDWNTALADWYAPFTELTWFEKTSPE